MRKDQWRIRTTQWGAALLAALVCCWTFSQESEVYRYDISGNRLSVTDEADAGAMNILDFVPRRGLPPDPVRILGDGFSAATDDNAVTFAGPGGSRLLATVLVADLRCLLVEVPEGAVTGPIGVEVVSTGESDITVNKFLVQAITVSPRSAAVAIGYPLQFSAEVIGIPGGTAIWAVNGVTGGRPETGTIDADGVYLYSGKLAQQQGGDYTLDLTIRATCAQAPYLIDEVPLVVVDVFYGPDGAAAGSLLGMARSVSYVNRRATLETTTVFPAESVSYVNRRATLAGTTVFPAQSVSYVNRRATLGTTTVFPAESVSYQNNQP